MEAVEKYIKVLEDATAGGHYVGPLIQALKDEDWYVRYAAVIALGKIQKK